MESADRVREEQNLRLILEGLCNYKLGNIEGLTTDMKHVFDFIVQHMQVKRRTPLLGEELYGMLEGPVQNLSIQSLFHFLKKS